jgi:hypothetical protein
MECQCAPFKSFKKILNHAARLVKRASKYDRVTPLLMQLHWLPIAARIRFKIAVLTFQCLNEPLFPSYIKEFVNVYIPNKNLRSASKSLLIKPKMKLLTYGERAFNFAAPDVWNSLPEIIKGANTLEIFKRKLKTHFFIEYFN